MESTLFLNFQNKKYFDCFLKIIWPTINTMTERTLHKWRDCIKLPPICVRSSNNVRGPFNCSPYIFSSPNISLEMFHDSVASDKSFITFSIRTQKILDFRYQAVLVILHVLNIGTKTFQNSNNLGSQFEKHFLIIFFQIFNL